MYIIKCTYRYISALHTLDYIIQNKKIVILELRNIYILFPPFNHVSTIIMKNYD